MAGLTPFLNKKKNFRHLVMFGNKANNKPKKQKKNICFFVAMPCALHSLDYGRLARR